MGRLLGLALRGARQAPTGNHDWVDQRASARQELVAHGHSRGFRRRGGGKSLGFKRRVGACQVDYDELVNVYGSNGMARVLRGGTCRRRVDALLL